MELRQLPQVLGIEVGYRSRRELQTAPLSVGQGQHQLVLDEVEHERSSPGRRARGMSDVVSPTEFTYSGAFHQWFCIGASANRVLPTMWVQRWTASRVCAHDPPAAAASRRLPRGVPGGQLAGPGSSVRCEDVCTDPVRVDMGPMSAAAFTVRSRDLSYQRSACRSR